MSAAVTIAGILAAPFVLWLCVLIAHHADEHARTATQELYLAVRQKAKMK